MNEVEIKSGGMRGFNEVIMNGRHDTAIASKHTAPVKFGSVKSPVAVQLYSLDSKALRVLSDVGWE